MDEDTKWIIGGALGLLALFGFIGVIAYGAMTNYERLLLQCLDAGHAEYECVGILRGHK